MEYSIAFKSDSKDENNQEQVFDLSDVETILGRGKYFGISDKRVSRNHAILLNQNNVLTLKSTHANPCFLNLKTRNKKLLLKQGGSIALEDGDKFSLLQDKFFFSVKTNDANNVNQSCLKHTIEENHKNFELHSTIKTTLIDANGNDEKDVYGDENESEKNSKNSSLEMSCVKKRKLPNWMKHSPTKFSHEKSRKTEENSMQCGDIANSSPMKESNLQDKRNNNGASSIKIIDSVENRNAIAVASYADNANTFIESLRDDSLNLKTNSSTLNKSSEDEEDFNNSSEQSTDEMAKNHLLTVDNNNCVGKNDLDCKTDDIDERTEPETSSSNNLLIPSFSQNVKREPCAYGRNCYQKNPIHRNKFSHPADDDYFSSESNDSDDDRPECEYGLQCYRKNPAHKKQFKHTRRMNPKRKLAKQKPKISSNDDYDSSFIDDDESEESLNEESDWTPSQTKQSKDIDSETTDED